MISRLIVLLFCCCFIVSIDSLLLSRDEYLAQFRYDYNASQAPQPITLSKERIELTYKRTIECILKRPNIKPAEFAASKFHFPADAEHHFELLKEVTSRYRREAPMHSYAGYSGPWIENYFISHFFDKPLSYFNGLIPLFIPWIDIHLWGDLKYLEHGLLDNVLRRDVLYFAVSQGDNGLDMITFNHVNILVLSAGGFGHGILPLIKGELAWRPPPTSYAQTIGFFGTVNAQRSHRKSMLDMVQAAATAKGMSFKMGSSTTWEEDMAATKINLAPRGYGRSSFRFAESVQMGRIPVFLHEDYSWAPYHGTNLSADHFGFIVKHDQHEVDELITRIAHMTDAEYMHRLKALEDARFHFTYPGVMQQLEHFFSDPFGEGSSGGNIKCLDEHPKHWT